MNQNDEVTSIRNKNIVDIALSFSAMNRLFERGTKKKIAGQLECSFILLTGVKAKEDFEEIHSDFCQWFVQNVSTAEKVLKNKKIKKSRAASYGQAAKVFDVALKVYVYYCNLPDYESAAKLIPLLHSAVDTLMMKNLIKKYPNAKIEAKTIEAVGREDYAVLQNMMKQHIEDEFDKTILPVHYDDIMWYRLNRRA